MAWLRGSRNVASISFCLVLLSLGAAPGASAVEAPQLQSNITIPDPLVPGGDGNASVTVQYCYSSSTAASTPATIRVALAPQRAWFTATGEPLSFAGDTGGQRCGSRTVALLVHGGRDAPAYQASALGVEVSSQGTTSSTSSNTSIPVQARYASEVRVTKPAVVRVPRGDAGTFQLPVVIGANGGTRIEITGRDPSGALAVQGAITDSTAGAGLDQTDARTITLNVAVAPGASVGMHAVNITVATHYATSPTDTGQAASVQAQVQVTEPAGVGTPGFEAALGVAAAALVAVGLRVWKR